MHFRTIATFAVLQTMLLIVIPSVTLGQFKNKKNGDPNKMNNKKNVSPGGLQPSRPAPTAPGANSAVDDLSQAVPAPGQSIQPNVLVEEDLDVRPIVARAGKLPGGLPNWFKDLADKNAQVPL